MLQALEVQTAIAGSLYGVNAFNQPGVEAGKQITYKGWEDGVLAYHTLRPSAYACQPLRLSAWRLTPVGALSASRLGASLRASTLPPPAAVVARRSASRGTARS